MPAGLHVRPTADKVKQALFNILGGDVKNALFLDLFAGTGGVGIEALSRGARRAVFVDDSRESLAAVRRNIEQAGFSDRAKIIMSRAASFLEKTSDQFDIVFLDPPYSVEQLPLLTLLSASGVLKHDSIVVSEHFKKQQSPGKADRLHLSREARYGDTVLAFYKVQV